MPMYSFFFYHPTVLTLAIFSLTAAVAVLFVWNIMLSMKIKNLNLTKNTTIKCHHCGCEQITVIKQTGNEGHKVLNVCQNCGESWEIGKSGGRN